MAFIFARRRTRVAPPQVHARSRDANDARSRHSSMHVGLGTWAWLKFAFEPNVPMCCAEMRRQPQGWLQVCREEGQPLRELRHGRGLTAQGFPGGHSRGTRTPLDALLFAPGSRRTWRRRTCSAS